MTILSFCCSNRAISLKQYLMDVPHPQLTPVNLSNRSTPGVATVTTHAPSHERFDDGITQDAQLKTLHPDATHALQSNVWKRQAPMLSKHSGKRQVSAGVFDISFKSQNLSINLEMPVAKARHCPCYDGASPRPGERMRARLIILVMTSLVRQPLTNAAPVVPGSARPKPGEGGGGYRQRFWQL